MHIPLVTARATCSRISIAQTSGAGNACSGSFSTPFTDHLSRAEACTHAVTDFRGQVHLLGHSDGQQPLHSAAAGRCSSTDNRERSASRLLLI